jgi:hypothetical protein
MHSGEIILLGQKFFVAEVTLERLESGVNGAENDFLGVGGTLENADVNWPSFLKWSPKSGSKSVVLKILICRMAADGW